MEDTFRVITGDDNPLHRDDEFAREIGGGKFRSHASFGMLTASLYSTIAGMYLPGKYSLIHSFDEISFLKPVFAGDVLTGRAEITALTPRNGKNGLVEVTIEARNQDGVLVLTDVTEAIVKRKPAQ